MEAKNVMNVTETEALVASDGERPDAPTEQSRQWPQGAFISIFAATTLICIPILAISGALLGLILAHSTNPLGGCLIQLPNRDDSTWVKYHWDMLTLFGGKEAYLVDYSATTLTTIAQWTSKLIPYLSSSVMALVAFSASLHILRLSRAGSEAKLPTTRQITILIGLLDSKGTAWSEFWTLKREHKREPLVSAFIALSIVYALGILIPVIDTWFGVVTTTSQCIKLHEDSPTELAYGRAMPEDCSWDDREDPITYQPCTLTTGEGVVALNSVDGDVFGYEGLRTYFGISNENQLLRYQDDKFGGIYMVSDKTLSSGTDIQARTLGVVTECTDITNSPECTSGDGDAMNLWISFQCTAAFKANYTWTGALGTTDEPSSPQAADITNPSYPPSTGALFFKDENLTQRVGLEWIKDAPTMGYSPLSPFYFGTWAVNYPNYGYHWILKCKTTILDFEYTWTNGSIEGISVPRITDVGIGGAIYAPFAAGLAQVPLNNIAELLGTTYATYYNDSTDSLSDAQLAQFAQAFGDQFSKASLSLASSMMQPLGNVIEKVRIPIQLARVPLVPLYLLLSLKLFYVFATLTLAVAVMSLTRLYDANLIKDKLSVKGLVAACFDPDQPKTTAEEAVKNSIGGKTPATGVEEPQPTKVGVVSDGKGGWEYAAMIGGVLMGFSGLVKPWVEPIAAQYI